MNLWIDDNIFVKGTKLCVYDGFGSYALKEIKLICLLIPIMQAKVGPTLPWGTGSWKKEKKLKKFWFIKSRKPRYKTVLQ